MIVGGANGEDKRLARTFHHLTRTVQGSGSSCAAEQQRSALAHGAELANLVRPNAISDDILR